MNNLQKIKEVAKERGLNFKTTNAKINGEKLYNFVDDFGNVIASN